MRYGNNYNEYGQLGLGDADHRNVPTQVGSKTWKQVSCGYNRTVAIDTDGYIWKTTHNGVFTQIDNKKWEQVVIGSDNEAAISLGE